MKRHADDSRCSVFAQNGKSQRKRCSLWMAALIICALSHPTPAHSAFFLDPQNPHSLLSPIRVGTSLFVATENDQEKAIRSHRREINGYQARRNGVKKKKGKAEVSEVLKQKFSDAQREKKRLKNELSRLRKEIDETTQENQKLRRALGDSTMSNFQLRYLETENARLQAELKATVEKASAIVEESRPRSNPSFYGFDETFLDPDFPSYAVYTNDTVVADLNSIQTETTGTKSRIWLSHRKIWKRRNAKSAQEGIRREKLPQLSSLLEKAKALDVQSPRYAARTIAGLVSALAEEVDDLDVEVIARPDTPFWDKSVDEVKITFSRLGFKPFKMGGLDQVMESYNEHYPNSTQSEFSKKLRDLSNADEAFRQIDVDNSGYLDREEIGQALVLAAGASDEAGESVIEELASDLLDLYDLNGDGVVDRGEYQRMVEDMAALSEKQEQEAMSKNNSTALGDSALMGAFGSVRKFVTGVFSRNEDDPENEGETELDSDTTTTDMIEAENDKGLESRMIGQQEVVNVTNTGMIESVANSVGSITLSDLKLDLRRLIFGAVPILKRITPGGPLILEPFTVTMTGSFNRDDIMKSPLIAEAALSRLIAMVLRRRVRSVRDLFDLAVIFGRDYKLTSKNAPLTEVTELTNVEFDKKNRLIMTGRAKIRTSPGAPTIEQAFKVRAKLGTRKGGRFIKLVEPELAFVLECPKPLEENVAKVCEKLDMKAPPRPPPIYSFFPIYSPFKVDDSDGFDLGEDNAIRNIYIKDGALRFELSAVLRPGRFLGSHYIAFTLPMRTFIITLDRVKEGMRAARKAKRERREEQSLQTKIDGLERVDPEVVLEQKPLKKKGRRATPKSFFSRFVNGYMQADRDEQDGARLASAVRDFFGRQSGNSTAESDQTQELEQE